MPRRTFLSWSRPLLPAAVDYLCTGWDGGLLDLSALVIVVPTAEAGRRLRAALALRAAGRDTAVLSPRIITPELITSFALQNQPAPAAPADELLLWMKVLLELPLENFPALFPVPPAARDTSWARGTAAELIRLRHRLEEGGLNIAAAAQSLGPGHIEAARWRDLTRVETACLTALRHAGLTDPVAARIGAADQPALPPGAARVVLLAVPDPVGLVISAMTNLEKQGVPVEVLIHGSAETPELWDEWGRPDAESWSTRTIVIPEPVRCIQLKARPADEADTLLVALKNGDWVGSADPAVATPLRDAAAREGIQVYDPNGQPLSGHEVSWLISCLTGLLRDDAASDAARLLRVPEMAHAAAPGTSAAALLRHWDEFHQHHLPLTLADAVQLSKGWKARGAAEDAPPLLHDALHWLQEKCRFLRHAGSAAALHDFLESLYRGRVFADGSARDLFLEAYTQWLDALEAAGQAMERARLEPNAVSLLETAAHLLKDARLYPENSAGAHVLSGWLELAWLDAASLTVAGMNEGFAPDGIHGDPWLPDSVRGQLGLRTNAVRLARDSFLLTTLIESRPAGNLTLLAARESSDADPLKPSRLLLRCAPEELPGRALHLFSESEFADTRSAPPAWHRAWKLKVPAPEREATVFTRMSVTQFSDYLACPFRFYLKHVLRMEPFDATRDEMDPRDFGSLIHDALQALHLHAELCNSEDESAIAGFLDERIQALTADRYGRRTALPLVFQLESARNRLRSLAGVHAEQRRAGWRVEHTEVSFPELPGNNIPVTLDEVLISGRIDLIERQQNSPRRRVLDYKTSAKGARPAEAHLKELRGGATYPEWQCVQHGGKHYRWTNLQLPLYAWIVSRLPGCSGGVQAGYVNLPPAISETAVNLWEEMDDRLIRSAVECARGVIRSIREGRFWPPAPRVEFDAFKPLIFDDVMESFDASQLEHFQKLQTR